MSANLLDYMTGWKNASDEYLGMQECGSCGKSLGDCCDGDCKEENSFDPYDVKYEGDGETLNAVEASVALGGPTVWIRIDRETGVTVEGAWWMRSETLKTDHDAEYILDDGIWSEYYAIIQDMKN